MNILILNWRDPMHPFAGGAEKITQKYANYWASQGANVYWLSSRIPNAKTSDQIDSVNYFRVSPSLVGGIIKLVFLTPAYFLNTINKARRIINDQDIDVVIDEIHGIPFFTPVFSRRRNILLVCEVADSIWDKMFPFPINLIGRYLEKTIYKIYSKTEIWAISKTTANDIKKILPTAVVKVLPLGIDLPNNKGSKKYSNLTLVFLARIVRMKGVEVALSSIKDLKEKFPNVMLHIIGKGSSEYILELKKMAHDFGIETNVNFTGKVSESDKYKYLSKSHFLIHPSFKEGFGLTVLEAAAVGTPAIVRAGGSLEELVENNRTGLTFKKDNDIRTILSNSFKPSKYLLMSRRARMISKKYAWQRVLRKSNKVTLLNF